VNYVGSMGKNHPSNGGTLPKWARIALRIVGAINATLALAGLYSQIGSAYFFFFNYTDPFFFKYTDPTALASFKPVFAEMTVINLAFIGVLLATALSFIRAKVSAVNLYSILVFLLFGYWRAIGRLWRVGGGFGRSVAAATGVGNMGIAFFYFLFLVPCLYPFVSTVLVQILKHRYNVVPTSLVAPSTTILSVLEP
jgi:hypothetical protein